MFAVLREKVIYYITINENKNLSYSFSTCLLDSNILAQIQILWDGALKKEQDTSYDNLVHVTDTHHCSSRFDKPVKSELRSIAHTLP